MSTNPCVTPPIWGDVTMYINGALTTLRGWTSTRAGITRHQTMLWFILSQNEFAQTQYEFTTTSIIPMMQVIFDSMHLRWSI